MVIKLVGVQNRKWTSLNAVLYINVYPDEGACDIVRYALRGA